MKLSFIKCFALSLMSGFIIGCSGSDDNGGDNDGDNPPVSAGGFEIVKKFNTSFINEGDVISASAMQNDGKILIATNNGIFRLNSDGSTDNSFNLDSSIPASNGASYFCQTIAVQNDGKILLGYYANNGTNQVLFRLNSNGSRDNGFTPNIKGEVSNAARGVSAVLPLNDGTVIVGGNFAEVDNQSYYYHLVKLAQNGSLAQSFQPHISPQITNDVSRIFALSGNRFMATGAFFTNQNLTPLRKNAIIFNTNGGLDESFNFTEDLWVQNPVPSLKRVFSVATRSDGSFLFGGSFNSIMKIATNGGKTGSLSLTSTEQINTIASIDNDSFLIGGETTLPFMESEFDTFLSVYNLSENTKETIDLGFNGGIIKNIIKESGDTFLLLGWFQSDGERTNIIRIRKQS